MDWRRVTPGDPWLAGRRPWVTVLAQAAASLGGTLEMESRFGHLARYRPPGGRWRPLFGNALGVNCDAAAQVAADKDYTARTLAAAGLPAVEGILVFSPRYTADMALKNARVAAALPGRDAAADFAHRVGWPVAAKPNHGSEGRGVQRAEDAQSLGDDLDRLFATDAKVRVERWSAGRDHRLVVLDGAVRIAYTREPAAIVGDGERSVAALLDALRQRLAATARGPKIDPASATVRRCLAGSGLALESVPAAGRRIPILPNANLSTGGTLTDIGADVSPDAAALAVAAAEAVGLRLAGVDILAADLTASADDAIIVEVNSAPGLDGYASASPAAWERARTVVTDALSR